MQFYATDLLYVVYSTASRLRLQHTALPAETVLRIVVHCNDSQVSDCTKSQVSQLHLHCTTLWEKTTFICNTLIWELSL